MFRFVLLINLCLCIGHLTAWNTSANDEEDPPADAMHACNDIGWSQLSVRILDPEGQPLDGVTVRPWALRAGNGHGWWNDESYGSPRRTKTDMKGTADVTFPKSINWGRNESLPVVAVSLIVNHRDFCSKSVHINVPAGEAADLPIVSLERGVRLRIAGVQPGSDRPLLHCHLMIEDSVFQAEEFSRSDDGWLESVPIRESRRWFRVVHVPPGEPPQFSKPQAWTPDDPASREVKVEVRPGVRVFGKVSDDVTRPIERGRVVAWCGSPAHREAAENGDRIQPIWWYETVPIDKDGGFEFTSLPSGYLAQFYAFANDSITAQPSDETFETCCKWFADEKLKPHIAFRYGQIARLVGSKSEITLDMEPAGQVRVKCVDPDGNPLRQIKVECWPNQYIVGAGSTIFCSRISSLALIQGTSLLELRRDNLFSSETNAEGVAIIRNLPFGSQRIQARNHKWISKDGEQVASKAGETTDAQLILQRIP